MKYTDTFYYGVIAKIDLHTELAKSEHGEVLTTLLALPTLLSIPFREREYSDTFKQKIKLTFIADIYDDYVLGQEHDDLSKSILELLGDPPFTVNVFDRWWQLVEFEYFDDTQKLTSELKSETLKLFRPSGNDKIDRWIDSLISQREDKDH